MYKDITLEKVTHAVGISDKEKSLVNFLILLEYLGIYKQDLESYGILIDHFLYKHHYSKMYK